ncbi:hypothetical protein BV898_12150 [Hypsibius exemplaris]|uniref:Uncharacterized protein n=1 Tax=Hypsibius exemplaris TaxID=2072580 RepID=A0A1W0WEK7_HYPEX|nr:hypothetical protein BV898_12150 [Hypsibius exemplaris]
MPCLKVLFLVTLLLQYATGGAYAQTFSFGMKCNSNCARRCVSLSCTRANVQASQCDYQRFNNTCKCHWIRNHAECSAR